LFCSKKTIGALLAAGVLLVSLAAPYSIDIRSNQTSAYSTSDIKPEPFKIGVIDSVENSKIDKQISEAIFKKDKSLTKLGKDIDRIPDDVDALWVSKEDITEKNIKDLFKDAKQKGKPFYVFGENLDSKTINETIGTGIDLEVEIGQDENKKSIDMMGYKFEDGVIKPSFSLSINRKEDAPVEIEELKKLTRRHNIKIKKRETSSLIKPNSAYAAGMDINVPGSYVHIYYFDTYVNNYIWMSSSQYRLAKTYHVWEVFKDETPADPTYKSYIYFRADEPLNEFDQFKSEESVKRLDADTTSDVKTTAWKPDNSTFGDTASFSIYPPSASVSWQTDGAIEIFGATGSLAYDWHSFNVEDNEYFDTMIRPGDTWVSSQSYGINQGTLKHKIGFRFTHYYNGYSSYAQASEYSKYDARSANDDFVWWVIAR
jgi:hypothetical protein